jgi:hypothetical protein
MLSVLVLCACPLLQEPAKPAAPDPARVKAALVELKEAFAKPDAGPRLRAIEAAAPLADADVVDWIARGLRDKDLQVQRAAIEALRFNEHPRALDPLHAQARQPAAQKDATGYAALLRAIGQHGSSASIAILTDGVWAVQDAGVIEARILSLGRIRTKESVKALIDLTEVAGPNKIQPFMPSFRLALCALTGADQGASRDLWLAWWRENKDALKVAPEQGPMPKELERRWHRYWAPPGAEEKDGKDGQGDGPDGKRRKPG